LRTAGSTGICELLAAANQGCGPIVIVARAHSGTRLLAEVLVQSGVYMGRRLDPASLDSRDWWGRCVLPLVASEYYPVLSDVPRPRELQKLCDRSIAGTLKAFLPSGGVPGVWGWKVSESLFLMPILKSYFPGARFLHLIRDGRDVALSGDGYFQLTSRHPIDAGPLVDPLLDAAWGRIRTKFRSFCLNVTFGNPRPLMWRGIRVSDRHALVRRRFTVQMQSWVHCVTMARIHGGHMGDDYCEVRYEDLCQRPEETVQRLYTWLNLPSTEAAQTYLKRHARTCRIGKWKGAELGAKEAADFESAVQLGTHLLVRLGYLR